MSSLKILLLTSVIITSQAVFSQETETRMVTSFNKLHVSGSLNAILQKGTEESVKVTVKGIPLDKIITEVKGNELDVRVENGNYHNNISVEVVITFRNIQGIDKSGSGNLECLSDVSASDFDFAVSGSGNIVFKDKIKSSKFTFTKNGSGIVKLNSVEADDAKISISGSGNFGIADGSAKKQAVHLSGSANVDNGGFQTNDCTASVAGSGNIEISVSHFLEGRIAGSGNITYTGNPEIGQKAVTGSGRITRKS